MINLLSVFLGGGIGSILRWFCSTLISSHWGTFVVNVVGAFCIGMAYTYFQRHAELSATAKTFVMTGLLGGFTTFSTYLLNFITLSNQNNYLEGFLYLTSSIIIGSVFLILGIKLVEFIQ